MPPVVQNESLCVGNRAADGHSRTDIICPCQNVAAGKGRALGRAVAVNQTGLRISFQKTVRMRCRDDVATGQQLPHTGQGIQRTIHHLLEQPGGQPQNGDVFALDQRAHFRQ